MKDTFILKSSIEKIGIDNLFSQKEADDLKYELDRGKKIITPSDCIGLDAEKRKLLSDTMRTISVPDDKLRELITTDEFKSIREIKCVVDEKEYQLDRDNIAWLFIK